MNCICVIIGTISILIAVYANNAQYEPTSGCDPSVDEHHVTSWINKSYHKFTMKERSHDQSRSNKTRAIEVDIEMHVQDISALDELTSDFEIDVLFSQMWQDKRLNYEEWNFCKSNISLKLTFLDYIWTPNTCLVNSKSSYIHSSPTDNVFVILYSEGRVWLNYRMKARGPCDLNLEMFPFDTQTCKLQFESYSYNTDEVQLIWHNGSVPAVVFMKKIKLPDFELTGYKIDKKTINYPNGHWDRLTATFKFERRRGFYMLQAYIPTYLTIVLSWVSFFMDAKALPARTTLGVSSLLALTLQFGNISKNLPRVSYIKSMDVWMLGCITFVFASMIQLAVMCLATKLSRKGQQLHRRSIMPPNQQQQDEGLAPRFAMASFYSLAENTDAPVEDFDDINVDDADTGEIRSQPISAITSTDSRSSHPKEHRRNILPNGNPNTITENAKLLTPRPGPVLTSSSKPNSKDRHSVPLLRWYHRIAPETVDYAAIVIFPLSFMIFNIFYWCYYLAVTTSHVEGDKGFMSIIVEDDDE